MNKDIELYKESCYNIEIEIDSNDRILLFNSLTNAVCWFSPEIYETFYGKKNIRKDSLLTDIIRFGFVVQNDENEYVKINNEKRKQAYDKSPPYLEYVIAPTMQCNYKCKYCFESPYSIGHTMSNETCEAVIQFITQQLKQFNPNRGIMVQWFGGEPLLALPQIEYISTRLIALTQNLGIQYKANIVTNGYYLTKDVVTVLLKCFVRRAQITLDGTREVYAMSKGCPPASFDRVIENIINAQDELQISLRLNLSEEGCLDMKKLIHDLTLIYGVHAKIYVADVREYKDLSHPKYSVSEQFETRRQNIIEYAKSIGQFDKMSTRLPMRRLTSCKATTMSEYVIGPTGNLYRCTHLLDRQGFESGTVFGKYLCNSYDMLFWDDEPPAKCHKCKIYPICMGGCAADRLIDGIHIDCDGKFKNIIYEVKQAVLEKGTLY